MPFNQTVDVHNAWIHLPKFIWSDWSPKNQLISDSKQNFKHIPIDIPFFQRQVEWEIFLYVDFPKSIRENFSS